MYDRNQFIAFQVIFLDVSKLSDFFVKNENSVNLVYINTDMWFNDLFCVFSGALSESTMEVKKFFPGGVTPPPLREKYSPICTKIMYDLSTAIINKCFEFQNDWLKIIPVRYNCTQFCPIPLC